MFHFSMTMADTGRKGLAHVYEHSVIFQEQITDNHLNFLINSQSMTFRAYRTFLCAIPILKNQDDLLFFTEPFFRIG